jgi:hypothetical protein
LLRDHIAFTTQMLIGNALNEDTSTPDAPELRAHG